MQQGNFIDKSVIPYRAGDPYVHSQPIALGGGNFNTANVSIGIVLINPTAADVNVVLNVRMWMSKSIVPLRVVVPANDTRTFDCLIFDQRVDSGSSLGGCLGFAMA